MNKPDGIELVTSKKAHLGALSSWFITKEQLQEWGGPHMRWPLAADSFERDIRFGEIQSWSLMDNDALIGFTQVYQRLGRHHLGRIATHPNQRGKGLGKLLVSQVLNALHVMDAQKDFSLFVYKHNTPAINLYEKLGFIITDYPEPQNMPGGDQMLEACHFMVKGC